MLGALLSAGCATKPSPTARTGGASPPSAGVTVKQLSPELSEKILAMNPDCVTAKEVSEILRQAPAPQVLCIHGGPFPIRWGMNSFSKFLIGMGYPAASIRKPGSDQLTYGYYHSSTMLAGTIAWHYERTGLRPIIVGHSMGGIQAIRVLHKLAPTSTAAIPVWNPLTDTAEARDTITDPLSGAARPVVGVQVGFVAVSVAGGLGRVPPNEWDMSGKLRDIPDSVQDFTGFQKAWDLLGGDYLGFGSANDYHAVGKARVRNVRLPASCSHSEIPFVGDFPEDEQFREWIEQYQPPQPETEIPPPLGGYGSKQGRLIWAAEVWHGIKKHWVSELQRVIRAQEPRPA
jgi:pimeloyl-ACP methyl ester carboxylesterase